METMRRLSALLPEDAAQAMQARRDALTELRLRAGRPTQLVWPEGSALFGAPIDAGRLREIACAMMDYSVYAREAELAQGFFTMPDGCRVGVCGRLVSDDGRARMTDIASICVRVARPVPGCADALVGHMMSANGLRSALVLSPPGMGKTTMLRDAARQLSEAGYCVGIADERHEIAACHHGAPMLDVGPRTDVMDGGARPQAIRRLIRSMAPALIVADEIGGEADAEALSEAARCGVAVLASAHADSLDAALARPCLGNAIEGGAFRIVALLGGRPGGICELRSLDGGRACSCA